MKYRVQTNQIFHHKKPEYLITCGIIYISNLKTSKGNGQEHIWHKFWINIKNWSSHWKQSKNSNVQVALSIINLLPSIPHAPLLSTWPKPAVVWQYSSGSSSSTLLNAVVACNFRFYNTMCHSWFCCTLYSAFYTWTFTRNMWETTTQRNATVRQRSISSQTHHVHRTQIVTPDHQQSHHWTHHSGSVSTVSIEQSIRRKATRDFTTWVARESSEPPPPARMGDGGCGSIDGQKVLLLST